MAFYDVTNPTSARPHPAGVAGLEQNALVDDAERSLANLPLHFHVAALVLGARRHSDHAGAAAAAADAAAAAAHAAGGAGRSPGADAGGTPAAPPLREWALAGGERKCHHETLGGGDGT